MTTNPNVQLVLDLLAGSRDASVVDRLVADDAVYVSLAFNNPDLTRVMPWAGTHKDGKAAILKTFVDVNRFWTVVDFTPQQTFGDSEDVAIFGSFTLRSTVLNKQYTSPFAVLARVRNGKVAYMQYMEDTFGTGATFRAGGQWQFKGNPDGTEVVV